MSRPGANPEIAQLAHDIANSLARAISRLSVLAEEDPPSPATPEIRDALAAIAEAREGLRQILEHSRGDARSRFSLLEAWRRAAAALEEAGIETQAEAAGPGGEALADPAQIGEILASIVGTERATGGPGFPVRARVRDGGARIVLDVRSAAPPFTAPELQRLHDPFFLQKPDGLGEGVGFAVCNRIAAKNGGAFAVADADGGRQYLLELPVAPAAKTSATSPAPAPTPPRAAPAGLRCLVVDDDPRVRESCALMLRHLEIGFESVASGQEALDRIAAEPFDVVLLDLNLGKPIDGDQVLEELRRSRPEMLARTVIATGDPTSETATRFSRDLGVAVLPKPFGIAELREGLFRVTPK